MRKLWISLYFQTDHDIKLQLLPAAVNRSEIQQANYSWWNSYKSLSWKCDGSLMINDILHVQTISQLPSVWDVGLSSAARGGDLAGAVVGGGVLPRACLHRGPGRDHEAGKLAQPRASASVHSRGGWERDCLSHQCVAQSTVGQLGADICTVAWNWLASTRGRPMASHSNK